MSFNPNSFPSTALDLTADLQSNCDPKSMLKILPPPIQRAGNANFCGITIISMATHCDVTKTRTSMCKRIKHGTALLERRGKMLFLTFTTIKGRWRQRENKQRNVLMGQKKYTSHIKLIQLTSSDPLWSTFQSPHNGNQKSGYQWRPILPGYQYTGYQSPIPRLPVIHRMRRTRTAN